MKKKSHFSLVELVVVVVVVAAAAAALVFWYVSVKKRNEMWRLGCVNNLKVIQAALVMYGNDYRSYMPDGDDAIGASSLMKLNYIDSGKHFVCPATKDTAAASWSELTSDGHFSYLYKGGLYINDLTSETEIFRDRDGNHGKSAQVLYGDFSVRTK